MEDIAALHKVMYVCVSQFPPLDCVCEGECGGLRKGGRAGGRPCLCSPKYLLLALCLCFPRLSFLLSFFFFSNLCTGIARGSDGGPIMTVVYTQRAGGLGGNRRASSYKPYSRIGQAGAFQHSWSSPSHRGSILRMFQYQLSVCI